MTAAHADELHCDWTLDTTEAYETTCGHSFVLTGDYALSEQPEFKFCTYCGKPLRAVERLKRIEVDE